MIRSLDRMSMAAKGRCPGATPGNRGAVRLVWNDTVTHAIQKGALKNRAPHSILAINRHFKARNFILPVRKCWLPSAPVQARGPSLEQFLSALRAGSILHLDRLLCVRATRSNGTRVRIFYR